MTIGARRIESGVVSNRLCECIDHVGCGVLSGNAKRAEKRVEPGGEFDFSKDRRYAGVRDLPVTESLKTTLDREIQYQAQVALARAVRDNGAKAGTIIVGVIAVAIAVPCCAAAPTTNSPTEARTRPML